VFTARIKNWHWRGGTLAAGVEEGRREGLFGTEYRVAHVLPRTKKRGSQYIYMHACGLCGAMCVAHRSHVNQPNAVWAQTCLTILARPPRPSHPPRQPLQTTTKI